MPRSFPEACDAFREALRELHAFEESPPEFPWPQCGARALSPAGPLPDLEGRLDSLRGLRQGDRQRTAIDPFMKLLGVASLYFQGFMERLDGAREEAVAASDNAAVTRLRVDKAIQQVLVEQH